MTTSSPKHLDRAVRLFEFLARAEQSTVSAPRTYERYTVNWARGLPRHRAVHFAHWDAEPAPGEEIGHIDRLERIAPPKPGRAVELWLVSSAIDDPGATPELLTEIPDREADNDKQSLHIDDHPEVQQAYESWLARWNAWADRERVEKPVRDAYGALFSMQADAASNPEELELVLAVGCLVWQPKNHPAVRRHLVTTPVAIVLDPVSGTLHVNAVEGPDPVRLELDMLDSHLTTSRHITDVRESARGYEHHPLHLAAIGELLQRVAHSLDPDGVYAQTEEPARGMPAMPQVTLAPAIVLRHRDHGLVQLLERIRQQLIDSQVVPEGVLPLVDPDHQPPVVTDPTPGALVAVDDDLYLPLPVNERQLQVLQQVDRHAQTLVQGPPGTGKTHTAAALLSHMLAQGKRVLVTAQTDRALKEVRAKLPEAIRSLSVAVVGASREDMADLKVAVNTISQHAIEFDAAESQREIQAHLEAIDRLRRQRADLYRRIVDVRSSEITRHEVGVYQGTLAGIAAAHRKDHDRYGWIASWAPTDPPSRPPLNAGQIAEWFHLIRDELLTADEGAARRGLPNPATLTAPAAFAAAITAEAQASAAHQAYASHRTHPAFPTIRALPPAERLALQQQLHKLADTADDLARRREAWMSEALSDVVSGRWQIWQQRAGQVRHLVEQAQPHLRLLGISEITSTGMEPAPLVALAQHLRRHLVGGAAIKLAADGTPVLGMLTAKPVKAARELFAHVRVDGRPPTSVEAIDRFLAWTEAIRLLSALDKAWPASVTIPPEDTFQERLVWHVTELGQLHRVLTLGAALTEQEHHLARLHLPRPQWSDLSAVRGYASLVDAATADDRLAVATAAVEAVTVPVATLMYDPAVSPVVHAMADAVGARDVDGYATAVHRIVRLVDVRAAVERRDNVGSRLREPAPLLHEAIISSREDPEWDTRLAAWDDAWAWTVTGAWLARRQVADLNSMQASVAEVERAIRKHVEELAAARAWRHAASPQRISGSARANLQQYGQLVRSLGKGTGKYAAQRRAEIRSAMDRCRPSVPVWIMPIYRIAEQLQVQPHMFDVVVVDEASQAGVAAAFLQYLAPKIVVIGDDRQVSPSAVGVDQQHLRNLGAQYLYDDPYAASWQDPKRSLFDEAKMRFSGLIPLTEHRRCVPEIINFSNRIAYEPENIRLIPVRQYGADRLEPIKPVFVEDGHVLGTTNKTNRPEAEAIVRQIVACTEDPRYAGLTFGVISLQGVHQAKLIERMLLERLDPAEWATRDLRCGDSADFQGSERDVTFLSMVAAVEPGVRIGSATAEMYLQRYNVAASRAKDQMWVFHSLRLSDLGNPEDMRHQLLDYCYGVAARPTEHEGTVLPTDVPEDRRVAPFDSLFEQRVYNRIVGRGFTVVSQFEALGYSIDLVVVGPHNRLAVECDGDTWHGPDRYQADMARQRELERCGWEFFRIPQSAFVVDEASVLQDLWSALERRGIRPSDWSSPGVAGPPAVEIPPAAGAVAVEERIKADDEFASRQAAPSRPAAGAQPVDETVVIEAFPAAPVASPADPWSVDDTTLVEASPATPGDAFECELPLAEVDYSAMVEGPEPSTANLTATAEPQPTLMGTVLLKPYETYSGAAPRPAEPITAGMREALVAIVECEGPVLGGRLRTAYIRAAGGQRVTRITGSAINKAITSAVRRGLLIQDNPLRGTGIQPCTFRLPNQPEVVLRELGPRDLEEVPPTELATVMAGHAQLLGWSDPHAIYRATLQAYGRKLLTSAATVPLVKIEPLARQLGKP